MYFPRGKRKEGGRERASESYVYVYTLASFRREHSATIRFSFSLRRRRSGRFVGYLALAVSGDETARRWDVVVRFRGILWDEMYNVGKIYPFFQC